MRSAPPIRLGVGIDRPWRVALAATAFVSAAMTAVWAWQVLRSPLMPAALQWLALAATLTVVAYGVAVWRRVVRQPGLDLAWDGQCWTLALATDATPSAQRVACGVRVDLDGGRWLLLRLMPLVGGVACAGPARWRPARAWHVALQAGCHPPATWHALRCALQASAARSRAGATAVRDVKAVPPARTDTP